MPPSIIPDVVSEQTVRTLAPSDSAHRAARLMAEHDISAIVVADHNGKLTGIVTERDLTRRVVAQDLKGSQVTVAAIMTPSPETIAPDAAPGDALAIMARLQIRHLPVVSAGKVLGIVSIRDLQRSVSLRILAI
jgi:CBS domain-containing protein